MGPARDDFKCKGGGSDAALYWSGLRARTCDSSSEGGRDKACVGDFAHLGAQVAPPIHAGSMRGPGGVAASGRMQESVDAGA